jgi:hypothetical protein
MQSQRSVLLHLTYWRTAMCVPANTRTCLQLLHHGLCHSFALIHPSHRCARFCTVKPPPDLTTHSKAPLHKLRHRRELVDQSSRAQGRPLRSPPAPFHKSQEIVITRESRVRSYGLSPSEADLIAGLTCSSSRSTILVHCERSRTFEYGKTITRICCEAT